VVSSREVIKLIKADGWYRVKSNGGSHQQFKHPTKKGRVTVPHPKKRFATTHHPQHYETSRAKQLALATP